MADKHIPLLGEYLDAALIVGAEVIVAESQMQPGEKTQRIRVTVTPTIPARFGEDRIEATFRYYSRTVAEPDESRRRFGTALAQWHSLTNPSAPFLVTRRTRIVADEIKPALTAEEWAHVKDGDDDTLGLHPFIVGVDGHGHAGFNAEGILHVASGDEAYIEGRRHGIAAFALYGQPFGFTRNDWATLTAVAELLETMAASELFRQGDLGADAYSCRSIADRIAALLPPRDANPAGS